MAARVSKRRKGQIMNIVKQVNVNLVKELEKVKDVTYQELIKTGLRIEAKAKKNAPVQTGNLRASGYTVFGGSSNTDEGITDSYEKTRFSAATTIAKAVVKSAGKKDTVITGFSASYAPYVNGTPGNGFLFFTRAVNEETKDMVKNMQKAARIK